MAARSSVSPGVLRATGPLILPNGRRGLAHPRQPFLPRRARCAHPPWVRRISVSAARVTTGVWTPHPGRCRPWRAGRCRRMVISDTRAALYPPGRCLAGGDRALGGHGQRRLTGRRSGSGGRRPLRSPVPGGYCSRSFKILSQTGPPPGGPPGGHRWRGRRRRLPRKPRAGGGPCLTPTATTPSRPQPAPAPRGRHPAPRSRHPAPRDRRRAARGRHRCPRHPAPRSRGRRSGRSRRT